MDHTIPMPASAQYAFQRRGWRAGIFRDDLEVIVNVDRGIRMTGVRWMDGRMER